MGRKPKLTPELQSELADILRKGHTIEDACACVGIDDATFHRWIAKGEETATGPFREFCGAIKAARARNKITLVDRLQKSATVNWKAAAWLLERQYPDEFGRRVVSAHLSGPAGEPLPAPNMPAPIVTVIIESPEESET